jgi:hypothetical protein
MLEKKVSLSGNIGEIYLPPGLGWHSVQLRPEACIR